MARRKKYVNMNAAKYSRNSHYIINGGRVIEHGEIIKIAGEHGCKFKFLEHVVNNENGAEWIDCFELRQGVSAGWRSFTPDRIKPLPKKRLQKNVKHN